MIALVADAHLGGPGGAPQQLVEQLRRLPGTGCRHLVFLGDLFHVWVADRRYESAEVREVLAVLQELRQRRIELSYVEGNRDFFLDRSPYASLFERIGPELSLEAGGKRCLLIHGDGLSAGDWRYRFWRGLSKSAAGRVGCRYLPAALGRRLIFSTESRLSRTGFEHQARIPEEELRAYGERRLRQGYDELVLGHFHAGRRYRVAGGVVRILEAWYRSRRIDWLEESPGSEEPSPLRPCGAKQGE